MDIEDDLKVGVKSTAILFGEYVYAALFVCNALTVMLLALAGVLSGLGGLYYTGLLLVFAALSAILWLIRRYPTREAAFRGFVANAGVGVLILFFIIIDLGLS